MLCNKRYPLGLFIIFGLKFKVCESRMAKKWNHTKHEHDEEIRNGIASEVVCLGCVSKLCENGSSALLQSSPSDLLGAMV